MGFATLSIRRDFPGKQLAAVPDPAAGRSPMAVKPPWGGDNVMFH